MTSGSGPEAGSGAAGSAGSAGPVGPVTVTVNGEDRALAAGSTVADLVAAEVDTVRGVAVAVNGELVPRSTWPDTPLAGGDRIELLSAAQGG